MFPQMCEMKVDDLLGLEPVRLDLAHVRQFLAGRAVLVTGAAGSIGSELCPQVVAHGPKPLVLYDRHQNDLFAFEKELQMRHPTVHLEPVLGRHLLDAVFSTSQPEVVFHAGAYKHVSDGRAEPA